MCVSNLISFVVELTTQRTYVRPSDYATPEEAVMEFASELEPSELNLERLIGGGNVNYAMHETNNDSEFSVSGRNTTIDDFYKKFCFLTPF